MVLNMTSTAMKRLAFILILLVGGIIGAIDIFWKSPATIAASELLVLFHATDAAAIEADLVKRYQTSAAQAQRIRLWIQAHQPIRSLALKKNGDGFTIMPDQATHYVVIKGQNGIGHLAVNVVSEQPPRSALSIVNDDMGKPPAAVPGIPLSP